ncbi:5'/3'-nucleotidase SurE [Rhodopirellula sp. SM50]|nr:5'/3'-nucleotidase SurE [Rhodopirellula sp. SM50]PAY16531.1 5'/3'-nucleotidase SurE [Rhodopirellula sp. SM50]
MLKILLTNDDGIDAPGIHALYDSVRHAIQVHRPNETVEIIAVAPDRCRSECGHSIVTTHPLTVTTVRENWHSVNGTPVDCIRVAHYAMDFKPDIVFSGINAGANLGVNLMISGTFAAAREASLLGIPALAASHYRRPDVPRTWDHTPTWLESTIGDFFRAAIDAPADRHPPPLWNVNLPAVTPDADLRPDIIECEVDRCPIDRTGTIEPGGRVRFQLDFHARPREQGRDVQHCFDGRITVSKLGVHLGR